MDTEYRKANILADLLDFHLAALSGAKKLGLPTEADERDVAEALAELAEQERIDGKPADPASERRGFTGGC